MKKGYLVLQNGQIYEGFRFGAEGESIGELVFTTGMGGYLETLTDPSYFGQIVIQTFPLMGNYGVIPDDFEGVPRLRAYVVREWCPAPSNFRSEGDLDSFLRARDIPGLRGVDTRRLTRFVRDHGACPALITNADTDPAAARNSSPALSISGSSGSPGGRRTVSAGCSGAPPEASAITVARRTIPPRNAQSICSS